MKKTIKAVRRIFTLMAATGVEMSAKGIVFETEELQSKHDGAEINLSPSSSS